MEHFIYVIPFNPHQGWYYPLFVQMGKWSSEISSTLPKVTQQISSRAGIQSFSQWASRTLIAVLCQVSWEGSRRGSWFELWQEDDFYLIKVFAGERCLGFSEVLKVNYGCHR